jgi:hypothetical protein
MDIIYNHESTEIHQYSCIYNKSGSRNNGGVYNGPADTSDFRISDTRKFRIDTVSRQDTDMLLSRRTRGKMPVESIQNSKDTDTNVKTSTDTIYK